MDLAQAYLKGITTLRLPFNHIHHFFVCPFSGTVALRPIVTSATAFFGHEDVFPVVQVLVFGRQDPLNNLNST